MPVALDEAALCALVGLGPHHLGRLLLDQGLEGVLQDLPEDVVLRVRDLAEQDLGWHAVGGHPVSWSVKRFGCTVAFPLPTARGPFSAPLLAPLHGA